MSAPFRVASMINAYKPPIKGVLRYLRGSEWQACLVPAVGRPWPGHCPTNPICPFSTSSQAAAPSPTPPSAAKASRRAPGGPQPSPRQAIRPAGAESFVIMCAIRPGSPGV
jgi:hypothetical protein